MIDRLLQITIILLFSIAVSVADPVPIDKAYIALEGEGKIAVVDLQTHKVFKQIDLSVMRHDTLVSFAPHNVQVAPNGQTVWVTANVHGHHAHHETETDEASVADELIVINPYTDKIKQRIPIAANAHLAHVVISRDGRTAYVNAQDQQRIYNVDVLWGKVRSSIDITGHKPHGLRLDSTGTHAFIAMLSSKELGILDTAANTMRYLPLGGAAVQTAVTADNQHVLVSLYDTKQIADYRKGVITQIALPADAKGPVQLYPSTDSKFVYVADQGYYFDQPIGNTVYKIDLNSQKVIKAIVVGHAPHGVVTSLDNHFVYVTNLLSDDVSIIDTTTDLEIARIAVGKEPNGISLWSKKLGGTP